MSFIQNFYTSRDNNTDGATYVGQQDRLWYNPDTNAIYVNSANVAGGTPVSLPATTNLVVNSITANVGNIVGDLTVGGNISPASDVKIGGVRAGPGANISNTGLLTIDTAGLPFSFGDFTANTNILTLVNVDQDMILATQGNAEIQLVGNIGFYKSNGLPPDPNNQFFFARDDGQIRIFVPVEDPFEGGVEIIGSATGNYITPGAPGTMLQLTGNPEVPVRFYMDGNGEYASFVARRWNGNVANPTQVLAGQDVLRINSTAATNLAGGNLGNVAMAQIRTTALENQTATAQGSSITFTVTPVGSAASARVDVANVTVADGVTATKFTTAGTVSATGNITGGNILTGGLISATGGITSGNAINDSLGNVRSIPQNSKNANYTLQATDNGQMINVTTGNVTVPAGVFTSPFGQTISIYNNQNASNAIVQGAGVTLRLAGTAATGNRTLARYGLSTIVCVAANTFVISGAGLT
jgi:hypothetical protein